MSTLHLKLGNDEVLVDFDVNIRNPIQSHMCNKIKSQQLSKNLSITNQKCLQSCQFAQI